MTFSIALLDDYQRRAAGAAPWHDEADVSVQAFHEHLGDADAVVAALEPFDMLVAMRERTQFPADVLRRLPNLKLLVTAGMRNRAIDMDVARECGITVCGTSMLGYPAAELAWGLVMSLTKRLPWEQEAMRAGQWQTTLATGLQGKTMGLWGLGKLGQRVARMAQAFEMDVIAWSENLSADAAAAHGVRRVEFEELMRNSDILSLHVILSDRTRGRIGARELGWMKPSAYLVNTSRGPLVDEPALIAALEARAIAGAGLDVFDVEPLPADHRLRQLDNVALTGHTGYVTEELYALVYGQALEALQAYRAGAPVNVLNA
ncbi:MAG: D-2-hydroxyacid dehydrogenase family protein [Pseudomonadota bacterium]